MHRRDIGLRPSFPSRSRLVEAAVELIAESGVERATIPAICAEAGLGERTFEEDFVDLTDCMLTVFDKLADITLTRTRAALGGEACWEDGVRAALIALLELADESPNLAGFMLGAPRIGDLPILRRREQLQRQLAAALEEHRPPLPDGSPSPAFGATAVIAATAAILHTRLAEQPPQPLRELVPALTAMIVLPYLGAEGARAQMESDVISPEGSGS
jgi:AcrR family transcriptional regulator